MSTAGLYRCFVSRGTTHNNPGLNELWTPSRTVFKPMCQTALPFKQMEPTQLQTAEQQTADQQQQQPPQATDTPAAPSSSPSMQPQDFQASDGRIDGSSYGGPRVELTAEEPIEEGIAAENNPDDDDDDDDDDGELEAMEVGASWYMHF